MLGFIKYLPWADPRDPIYLTIVNLLLGLTVVVLVLYILVVTVLDFKRRREERKQRKETKSDLKNVLSKLGVTMQDGGEKLHKNNDTPKT
jgi:hypothetical protein